MFSNKGNKNVISQNTKGKWEGKRVHGQFPHNLDEELVDD
jgi:hypothetical protein